MELTASARRLVLINVCVAQFMGAIDARSLNVALPTLSTEFGATMAVIQWVPIAYQLTLIGLVLSLGRLGDVAGRKKIYNLGFMIFFVGSLLCGLATGVASMVLFQILEGIGGAMILANGRAIVTAVFPAHIRGRALGITSTAFHLGYIVGPSLAGFLIDTLGWRWVFFVNLPVILVGIIMSARVIPETVSAKGGYRVDLPGAATLLAAVSLLLLTVNREAHHGFDGLAAGMLLLAAALSVLFVYIERRTDEPLLDVGLFGQRVFAAGIAALALVSLAQRRRSFCCRFTCKG
jgi:MFS family permease